MKKYLFSVLLLPVFFLNQLQAQQISSVGLQWSSSKVGYNIPFGQFSMGSELVAYGMIRWGRYLAFIPEIGLRQFNQTLIRNEVDSLRYRIRSVHAKINMIFPFSKSFHASNKGWFASIGFSRNLGFNFREEQWQNGELVSLVDLQGKGREGDFHIGLGYTRPLSNSLNLLVRGEYAEGFLGNPRWRRNELSLGVGLGWKLNRPGT